MGLAGSRITTTVGQYPLNLTKQALWALIESPPMLEILTGLRISGPGNIGHQTELDHDGITSFKANIINNTAAQTGSS